MRPGRMPPRAVPEAVEWIEFAVSEEEAGPLGAVFAGPRLPADRAASLEGGGALAAGRDQPRRQHRAGGPRAFAPDRARAVGRGARPPGRRRGRGAGRGPRRCGWRRSASRSARASSTSRRSAASAARWSTSPTRASDLGRVWEIEFEPTGERAGRHADPDRPRRAVDDPRRDAELAALVPVAVRLRDHAAGRRGRPGGDRREHGAAGPGPGAPGLPERQRPRADAKLALPRRVLRRRRAAHRLRHRRHLRGGRGGPGGRARAPADPGQLLRRPRGALRPRSGAVRPAARGAACSTTRTRAGATSSSTRGRSGTASSSRSSSATATPASAPPNAPIRLAAQARLARGAGDAAGLSEAPEGSRGPGEGRVKTGEVSLALQGLTAIC